jgi:heptosyltransferase-2
LDNKKILILQTAFLGDVILTLPLVQVLKKNFPESEIDFVCIPGTSEILKNNPHIHEIIPYDKRNAGVNGFTGLIKKLRNRKYGLLISPHRSFRSSLISYLSSPGKSVSFDNSSFGFLYDKKEVYDKDIHEIQRNLSLLNSEGIREKNIIKPELFLSVDDKRKIDCLFYEYKINDSHKIISIAPGSVWFTKKFPEEKFVKLCDLLSDTDYKIFLTGGKNDKRTSDFIANNSRNRKIINVTGHLSVPESAELISRSDILITNDSAPLHIANAVGTDVIAVFGATVPAFGFYPYGKDDIVFETNGLSCRPCAIHGGKKCPVGTFECMLKIDESKIAEVLKRKLS